MPLLKEDVQREIAKFDRWHYQFDLDGVVTPIHDKDWINRHAQRKQYFFDPLVYGEKNYLNGKRVLDLGCNAGFWSLAAIESGASYVVGIDARQMHIEQAKTVFNLKGIPETKYDFINANIFDYDLGILGNFDIVFCLGFFYHISKPIELLEKIGAVNSDLLIIDTKISRSPVSMIEIHHEPLTDPRMAADYSLVFVPSAFAVIEMAKQFGYESLVLEPNFKDWTGCPDYKDGDRKAFLCSKRTKFGDTIIDSKST